jgi:hypothetical protein
MGFQCLAQLRAFGLPLDHTHFPQKKKPSGNYRTKVIPWQLLAKEEAVKLLIKLTYLMGRNITHKIVLLKISYVI